MEPIGKLLKISLYFYDIDAFDWCWVPRRRKALRGRQTNSERAATIEVPNSQTKCADKTISALTSTMDRYERVAESCLENLARTIYSFLHLVTQLWNTPERTGTILSNPAARQGYESKGYTANQRRDRRRASTFYGQNTTGLAPLVGC